MKLSGEILRSGNVLPKGGGETVDTAFCSANCRKVYLKISRVTEPLFEPTRPFIMFVT